MEKEEFKLEKLTTVIRGGFLIPNPSLDTHLGAWQLTEQKLDHDNFLPPLVCEYLKENKCKVVLDLGAFNGDHSIAYNRVLSGVDGLLISVEAGKLAFECLKHNCALFQHPKNIYPLHAAISDICGQSVSWNSNSNLGASTCQDVDHDKRIAGHTYMMTVTVDYIAQELAKKKIDFIKCDIEGYEVRMLLGAGRTLQNDRPSMLLEVNSSALMGAGDTVDELYTALDYHKYDWKIVQPELTVKDPMYDILCTPKP